MKRRRRRWQAVVAAALEFCVVFAGKASNDKETGPKGWSPGYSPPDSRVSWENSLTTALGEARKDGKPVLLHVFYPFDLLSVVTREWLTTDPQLAPLLRGFHCVEVASDHESLKGRDLPHAPALILGADGAPQAVINQTSSREKFVAQFLETTADLKRASESPQPSDPFRKIHESIAQIEKIMREQGASSLRKFIDEGKGETGDRLEACRIYLRQIMYDPTKEDEAKKFTRELIHQLADKQEMLEMVPVLVEAMVQLDMEDEHMELAETVARNGAVGPMVAAGNLKLADRAVENGDLSRACACWDAAEKAAIGQSEALRRAARAARALMDPSASPNRTRWARRKAADAVVLVPDTGAFLEAIGRWTADEFFPVLFQDDRYAPRFVEAYKPKVVYLAPPTGIKAVDPAAARRAALAAWGDGAHSEAKVGGSQDLAARLKELGDKPQGVVFFQATAGEALGGVALAAGRFQGLEPIACAKGNQTQAKAEDVFELEKQVRAGLARYDLPEKDGRWAAVTLAANVPYRCIGVEFPKWGNNGAVDDALGRWDDSTRYAAVGRLLGDAPQAVYQAMCSLFLTPKRGLFFNNYGLDPKTIWGFYRTTEAAQAFAKRMPTDEIHPPANTVEKFRALTTPWNSYEAIFINSAGGLTQWMVGGGGWTDDFPVGNPSAIYIIHSGSAGNPYDPDSLAGRAIWGGTFWYFGSTAEPFLAAFQAPCAYMPRLLAGAPYAAAFRERMDDRFWSPWRLMIVGDPLFCLREKPLTRTDYRPASGEKRLERIPAGKNLAALRAAVWLGDLKTAMEVIHAAGLSAPWIQDDGEALALVVTCLLRNEAYPEAVAAYQGAKEGVKAQFAARASARAAAAALVARAVEEKDAAALKKSLGDLAAIGAPPEFFIRFVKNAMEGGPMKANAKEREKYLGDLIGSPGMEAYKPQLQLERARNQMAVFLEKKTWNKQDMDGSLAAMQELMNLHLPGGELGESLKKLMDASLNKLAGSTAESFVTAVRTLKPLDSDQKRVLDEFVAQIEKERPRKTSG